MSPFFLFLLHFFGKFGQYGKCMDIHNSMQTFCRKVGQCGVACCCTWVYSLYDVCNVRECVKLAHKRSSMQTFYGKVGRCSFSC